MEYEVKTFKGANIDSVGRELRSALKGVQQEDIVSISTTYVSVSFVITLVIKV